MVGLINGSHLTNTMYTERTPGEPGRAQPTPHETTPVWTK